MINKYGLLGKTLSHSYSAKIHQLLGNIEYRQRAVDETELDKLLTDREFLGYNVTIPYKQAVIPYCDSLSESAGKIGSVNTLINKNGRLHGDNTDYFGFLYMANKAGISFKGKKVAIFGSGGTSLTARTVVADEGAAVVTVVSRSGKINYKNLEKLSDYEIIINTTPVGMYPNNGRRSIDLNRFPKCEGVIDAIYNPLYTEILFQAKEKGILHTNGLSMLVAQAVKSHELFFETKLDEKVIDAVTAEIENDVTNIVLIGMPGSGKTTLAKGASQLTGRKFIDTDRMTELMAGMRIPQIFAEQGEAAFRELEAAVIREAGKGRGAVIATGGGCMKSYENYKALKQNGRIFYLERDIVKLEQCGRPLSKDINALEKLYNERKSLYETYCDERIDSNQTIEKALCQLLEKI